MFYELEHGHQGTGFGLLAATAVIVVCLIAPPTRPAGGSWWLKLGVLLLAAITTLALRPSMKAMASDTGLLSFAAAVAITIATVWLIKKKAGE